MDFGITLAEHLEEVAMNLNGKQRKIVIVGVVLFVLMGLIPPWTYTLDAQSIHREKPAGYALIISSPGPEKNALLK